MTARLERQSEREQAILAELGVREIPGIRMVDFRDFPEGTFDNAMERLCSEFARLYESDMQVAEADACMQTLALGLVLGRDPFSFRKDSTINEEVLHVNMAQGHIKKVASDWFRGYRGTSIVGLVRNEIPSILDEFEPDRDEVLAEMKAAIESRRDRYNVPGDPNYADTSMVAGLVGGALSPTDPRIDGDNQSLHHGQGYDA